MSVARIVYREPKVNEETARKLVELMLPLCEGLEPFRELDTEDLGDPPEHTPCWESEEHDPSFRIVRRDELEDAGITIPDATQRDISSVRLLLKELGLDRGRVVWHAAECQACRTFRLRPAVAVRVNLGGGIFVEREYGIGKVR